MMFLDHDQPRDNEGQFDTKDDNGTNNPGGNPNQPRDDEGQFKEDGAGDGSGGSSSGGDKDHDADGDFSQGNDAASKS